MVSMFFIAKLYRMASPIANRAQPRSIFGVIEPTFMLDIWFVCSIYQNRVLVNFFLNHKRIDMINGWQRIHVKTWVLTTKKLSFKPVRNWIACSLRLCYWVFQTALQRHQWAHVQIGNGRWELSSSHSHFNSRKYSIRGLDFCFRLLIVERSVNIQTGSTLENRSCKSFQASNAFSWKIIVEAICSLTKLMTQEWMRWLQRCH